MNKNAVILVDKASGITSFDCLGRIKRNVNKKSGHCGTLDKFAHGLIIVLCGSYTHLVPAFMGLDKTYEALIEFGKMTDTLDPEGNIVEQASVPSYEQIQDAVKSLLGPQMQVPPIYSAVHVNGVRSYKIARSGDSNVELNARKINIYSSEIISYEEPFLKIRLKVSKGTYIRSYARDLGHLCNSCAYVKELYRTEIGPFKVQDAIAYDDVEALKIINKGEDYIRKLDGCLDFEINDIEAQKASNGYILPSLRNKLIACNIALLKHKGKIVCVYSVKDNKILCQVRDEDM